MVVLDSFVFTGSIGFRGMLETLLFLQRAVWDDWSGSCRIDIAGCFGSRVVFASKEESTVKVLDQTRSKAMGAAAGTEPVCGASADDTSEGTCRWSACDRRVVAAKLVAASPYRACATVENADAIKGAIALVERGDCSFMAKARHAEMAGAIGLVVVNNVVSLRFASLLLAPGSLQSFLQFSLEIKPNARTISVPMRETAMLHVDVSTHPRQLVLLTWRDL